MDVALVVAMTENGVIGRAGGLPWGRLSSDLRRFKAQTMGKPVVMGRKTWESIGRPLPGRLNIVVTRSPGYAADGAAVVPSLAAALERARAEAGPQGEVCVIGGGEIYRQAMAQATRLYVTHVLADLDGDTRFPAIDPDVWKPVAGESLPADEKNVYPTRHVVYERRERA
ncbi:dihydrofolate reductase [Aquibium sp. A9E412]|uniref:dihydrofolate reductase n=1 Tax=Aquibium sp. A9E412 TaxID=2976767 RepID=UPI0025B170F9|nr:dihydrofolate reductase [Aquibium sp. A9E412]MDN2566155.1 dihydrofolate reductase [Aquibium sp. A9E412]